MLLPLRPMGLPQIRSLEGWRRGAATCGAVLFEPLTAAYRFLARRKPTKGVRTDTLDLEAVNPSPLLPQGLLTTHRSKEWLRWRFVECPYRNEVRYYNSATANGELLVVVRSFLRDGHRFTRILDLSGDLDHREAFNDVMAAVARDAVTERSTGIAVLAANRQLQKRLRRCGFLLSVPTNLRWWSREAPLMDAVEGATCHFALADSDNDSLV
jgi:hypothetical protein